MQFKIEENKPKPFEPITITITLESAGELADLANRLDINHEGTKYANIYKIVPVDNFYGLWQRLDNVLAVAGLKK
jgi:hypothetical protein